MSFIGNLIWFIFGGWLIGLGYLLGAILFFPLIYYLWPVVGYAFWPFGRKPVSRSAINKYMERNPEQFSDEQLDRLEGPQVSLTVRRVLGVLWALTFGWILALGCLLGGVLNLLLCVLLITIPICLPNAMAWFKLAGISFVPFTMRIVPTPLSEEILSDRAKSRL